MHSRVVDLPEHVHVPPGTDKVLAFSFKSSEDPEPDYVT